MITIEKVELYGNKLKDLIADIKHFIMVLDDSQIVNEMKDVGEDQNLILVGFIPSHKSDGTDVDNVQNRDYMLWMILNKVDRRSGQAEFLASFKRCQSAALLIQKQMLADKPFFDANECTMMRQLDVPTISIDPVWALAGCDGYEINYQLKTPIY